MTIYSDPFDLISELETLRDICLQFALCNRDNEGTRRDVKKAQANITDILAALATPAQASSEDARDAARYRWLRDNVRPWEGDKYPCADMTIWLDECRKFGCIGQRDGVGICTLDVAVDAALATPAKEGKI